MEEPLKSWIAREYEAVAEEVKGVDVKAAEFTKERTDFIKKEGRRKEKVAATIASIHGTGTKANDYNGCSAINQTGGALRPHQGQVPPTVFEKHLTGHPLPGGCSTASSRSASSRGNRKRPRQHRERRLGKFRHTKFLQSLSIQTDGVRAAHLKSFGFVQTGDEIIPSIRTTSLRPSTPTSLTQAFQGAEAGGVVPVLPPYAQGCRAFVPVKNAAPDTDAQQSAVYQRDPDDLRGGQIV
ncbi:3-oxoacyl-[acyl-carrier-protein] synthase [Irineochytrium annulatum]|nr:3-oxoacyl-[acyl-carrier-protein] synthase [Irineochytrium annulatum]